MELRCFFRVRDLALKRMENQAKNLILYLNQVYQWLKLKNK
ncbi:hypothetical protein MCERE19_00585 [Spirosomataceae bacterium]